MTNALYALAVGKLKLVSSDEILIAGDTLYLQTDTLYLQTVANLNISHNHYLLASELPEYISTRSGNFTVMASEPKGGLIFQDSPELPFVTLLSALQYAFDEPDINGCLVILSIYAVSVFFDSTKNQYYVFDSHSRDTSGMSCSNGTSVLMKVGDDTQSVRNYIELLARSLGLHLHRMRKFEVIAMKLACFQRLTTAPPV